MKKILKTILLNSLLVLSLIIHEGCDPDNENETPSNTCKVIQTTVTKPNSSENAAYEYNAAGQIISATLVSESEDDSGQLESKTNNIADYTYNSDGFLVKSTSENEDIDESGSVSKTTYTSTYKYQNGRLITLTLESDPVSYSYVYTYEYDAAGNLTKYIFTTTWSTYTSSNTFDFKTKKVVMKGFTGVETTGELNADGYLIKEVNIAGIERRYNYSNDGNLLRQEVWSGGKLQYGTEYEYDNKLNPDYAVSISLVKGMPELKLNRIFLPTHNYKKETNFKIEGTEEVITASKDYAMQYNSSGYPVVVTISENDANGALLSTTTKTYAFKDCN